MKLIHWPLMDALLNLVIGTARRGLGEADQPLKCIQN